MRTFVLFLLIVMTFNLFSTQYINYDVDNYAGIELFFGIDKFEYETGDHVEIKFKLTNLSGEPRPYYWPNSYTHDAFVYRIPGDTIWTMVDMVIPWVEEGVLEPGDSLWALHSWNMEGDNHEPIEYANNYHMCGYWITEPCIYLFVNFDYDETETTENTIADIGTSNHPNPFNPSTVIRYQVSGDSEVSLKIYNVKGQLVNTLVNDLKPAGEHSVIWNGRDDREKPVESGSYLYQLRAGSEVVSRKMVLVK